MTKRLEKIRTGAFSRGLALARVSASASARAAGHVLGNLFSGEETRAERLKRLLVDQVGMLAKELGELKGSLMKVGQLLSMYGEQILPPEVNAVLKSLQSQAPPLDWKAIEPMLLRALGPEKLGELEIDHEALASASLGQVHKATIKSSGEELARQGSVSRSGQGHRQRSQALRRILSVSKLLPGREPLEAIQRTSFSPRSGRCSTTRSTSNASASPPTSFREILADDRRYLVARTYPRYSGRRVLATELIRGVPVDGPEVRALPQDRRDAIGAAALELYFREIFRLGTVQTDPHFGNYRVVLGAPPEGDRLALFDFGAVRVFPDRFLRPYRKLCLAAFRKDLDAVAAAAIELGFLREDDSAEQRALFAEICFLFLEPFEPAGSDRVPSGLLDASGAYDWGKSDLPEARRSPGRAARDRAPPPAPSPRGHLS